MIPPFTQFDSKKRLVLETLEPILAAVGRPLPDMREIIVTERSVVEKSTYDGLTREILDHDIPEITTSTLLDHYTEVTGFRGIVDSQELRLAPLTFRLAQGELATFAWEHGLFGYVEAKGRHKGLLREAAADLFYASFCTPPASDHLWDRFGGAGNGYRLRFKVNPNGAGQLRAIRYHGAPTLLKRVNDALMHAGLPQFVLKGVSRIGAFYLPVTWKDESETRLLAKRFGNAGAPVVSRSQGEYWPVPIGVTNPTAEVELVEIGLRKLDPVVVQSKLPRWCSNIPVVLD